MQVVSWLPPSPPYYNIDGSSLGNPGPAGGGKVLRDGHIVAAQAAFFGHSTSLSAEIQALYAGLHLCQNHFSGPIVIESDSMLLVDMLHSRATWPWKHYDT